MLLVIAGAGASHDSMTAADSGDDPIGSRLARWDRHYSDFYKAEQGPDNMFLSSMDPDGMNAQRKAAKTARAHRPPLTEHLFDEAPDSGKLLREQYQMLGGLVSKIRGQLSNPEERRGLEEILEGYQAEADKGAATRQSELMALQFFLRDALDNVSRQWDQYWGGQDAYSLLVSDVAAWAEPRRKVCYVTFNYDTLLDRALWRHNLIGDSGIDDYISDPDVRLIKPHGSTNWARELPSDIKTNTKGPVQIASAGRAAYGPNPRWRNEVIGQPTLATEAGAEIEIRGPSSEAWERSDPVVPVVALPLVNKDGGAFVAPTEHITCLQEQILGDVTRIVVIGWRAAEQHFLELLVDGLPKEGQVPCLVVCGRDGGAETRHALEKKLGSTVSVEDADMGFRTALQGDRISGFLTAD